MRRSLSPLAASALKRPAPNSHPPVRRRSASLHGLLALLLAAAVATLVVWADRTIDTWTDGHLFLAWVALWLVIFAGSALLDSWTHHKVRCLQEPAPKSETPDRDEPAPLAARPAPLESKRSSGFLPYL